MEENFVIEGQQNGYSSDGVVRWLYSAIIGAIKWVAPTASTSSNSHFVLSARCETRWSCSFGTTRYHYPFPGRRSIMARDVWTIGSYV